MRNQKIRLLLISLLLLQGVLFARITITSNTGSGFVCEFIPDKPFSRSVYCEKDPSFETAFIAIPEGAEVTVTMDIQRSSDRELIYAPNHPNEAFTQRLGKMRNINMGLLYLPVYYHDEMGNIRRVERAEVTVSFSHQFNEAFEYIESEIFDDVYENIFLNHCILPRHLHGLPGSYIILSPEIMLDAIAPFVEMKKEMGYLVNLFVLEDIGSDPRNTDIADFLRMKYDEITPTPDLVLLIGDTRGLEGSRLIDHGYRGYGGTYASDHGYALFDPEDYIPDVLIGRFTVANPLQLEVVVHKNHIYTMQPDLGGTEWISKGMAVATDLYAMSAPLNAFWSKEIMLRHGFTLVDTVVERAGYSPPRGMIKEKFDDGRSLTTYRGFGSSLGWWNPEFDITDVHSLNNSPYFGIVTTMVCGTADFRIYGRASFGEVLLHAGTLERPRGAAAVYGPSDHDTNTRYNNPLNVGFYEGLFTYDFRMIGQAALFSKLNEHLYIPLEPERIVHYFHVYNILGDPGLYMWSGKIDSFDIIIPDSLISWGGEFEVRTDPPVEDVWVCLYYDDTGMQAVGRTDAYGVATIAYPHEMEVFATITAWKKNYKPVQREIYVRRRGSGAINFVSVEVDDFDGNGNGILEPGETANLTFTLDNTGSYLASGDFHLGSYTPGIEVIEGRNSTIIDEGEFTIGTFTVSMDSDIGYIDKLDLWLTVIQRDTIVRFHIPCDVPYAIGQLEIIDYSIDGELMPSATAFLDMELKNIGEGVIGPMELKLTTESGFLKLSENVFSIPAIAPGETYLADVSIALSPDNVEGAIYPLILLDVNGHPVGSFTVSNGTGGPTGPDGWGYLAFDQTDVGYPDDLEWIEISSIGTAHFVTDDYTFYFEMPFPLRFYGESYDTISICENGWIAPGVQPFFLIDFYNLPIPGPGGPWGIIAPMWDDLKPRDPAGDSILYTHYDTERDVLIIQWEDFMHRDFDDEQTFQVQIFNHVMPSGDNPIAFIYQTTMDADTAQTFSTVGIEHPNHRIGLEYRYSTIYTENSTPFDDDFGIFFTTEVGMARLSGQFSPRNTRILTQYGQKPVKLESDFYLFRYLINDEDVAITASARGHFTEVLTANLPANSNDSHNFILEIIPLPSGLTAVGEAASIRLWWSAPTGTSRELTGYNIYRSRSPYGRLRYHATTDSESYTDSAVDEGFYWYAITAVYGDDESFMTEKVDARSMLATDEEVVMPLFYGLSAPSPNPFNSAVSFVVNLPVSYGLIEVFDARGKAVLQKQVSNGRYNLCAEDWASGVYILRLSADTDEDYISTRKMFLVK